MGARPRHVRPGRGRVPAVNPRRSDVVVVGAGIVGLCSAWYLRKSGAEVTVLSREPLPGGDTSAGNAGMIVPSHVVPLAAPGAVSQGLRYLLSRTSPFHIKPRLDPGLIRWLWRFWRSCTEAHVRSAAPVLRDLSLASVGLLTELQIEGGDFAWEQTGLLMVYHSEKYRSENLWAAELAESLGLRLRRLDGPSTLELEPGLRPETLGSVLYEDDGRVNPSALLARLREGLVAKGVALEEGEPVVALERPSGGGVLIHLEDGKKVEAGAAVLAAGAWTGRIAASTGARVPLQPAKGYSLTFPAPERRPSLPVILSEEKVTITPFPDALRFAGTFSLSGFDHSVDDRRVEPIREEARRLVPELADQAMAKEKVWVGFRPASPDGLPIVGPLAGHPEVVVATGHGMTGMTLGPITGRLVADLVSGADPVVDPGPLDPARF